MLSEFLAFLIEKGFIKNSNKIATFLDIYNQHKASSLSPHPKPTPED